MVKEYVKPEKKFDKLNDCISDITDIRKVDDFRQFKLNCIFIVNCHFKQIDGKILPSRQKPCNYIGR